VVGDFAGRASIAVSYCVEPRQNVALARNRAVDNASGDFIAFIDDDEEPFADWLLYLHDALTAYGADGAIGPGVARFVAPPPAWAVRGGFFERPSRPTGALLHWRETRTGNALLRRRIFAEQGYRFRAEYRRGGEDSDLFRRLIADGMRIVACADAKVYRIIRPSAAGARTCSNKPWVGATPRTIAKRGRCWYRWWPCPLTPSRCRYRYCAASTCSCVT
jgi:succinoglycan biosynthesis protein ExoM